MENSEDSISENLDRWNAQDKPIRFKDLGFLTTEKLEKTENIY